MKVKATFIGANSLGYINGKEYCLIVNAGRLGKLTIKDIQGEGKYCLYANLFKFLENWKNVTLIE